MSLLEVKDLHITFNSSGRKTEAVKGISFSIEDGDSVAIVGESGSGKTVTAMSFTNLLPPDPICEIKGKVVYDGKNILEINNRELRKIRGREIAYIFQEASVSLNPVFTIGSQIAEAIKLHFPESENVQEMVIESLREVGISNPELRCKSYPYELSGGMQQRAMIAMALSCKPKLLIADEPTTALDVSVQKQIIDLLKDVRSKHNTGLVLITHNFGIISELCKKVIVMFRGKIVEEGNVADVLYNPQHPYTKALIACIPRLGKKNEKLQSIDYSKL